MKLVTEPQNVTANVDVLIVAVPAGNTYEAFQMLKPSLKPDTIYVDVSASSPPSRKAFGEI